VNDCPLHPDAISISIARAPGCTCLGLIDDFTGQWFFLSNFSPYPVSYDDITYPTVEHAFQALKTLDQVRRRQVAGAATPGIAKKMGRKLVLRDDWEQIKEKVMQRLLAIKFEDPALAELLLATGSADLVEGNNWHDQIWGSCRCPRHLYDPGRNLLGRFLADLRAQLRAR
jgi:hypothetical protein